MSSAHFTSEPRQKCTVEQYLVFERATADRQEYFDGEIVSMARESLAHAIISANILGALATQLKGTPCFAVTKDTKVRSGLGVVSARSASGMFSYPDIVVICGEPDFFDDQADIIMNPTAIIEVLSKSTELFDRGDKFLRYRTWNPSLQEYTLVSQTKPHIEHFRRKLDGGWEMQEAIGLETAVEMPAISCALKLADVYDRITFPDAGSPEA